MCGLCVPDFAELAVHPVYAGLNQPPESQVEKPKKLPERKPVVITPMTPIPVLN